MAKKISFEEWCASVEKLADDAMGDHKIFNWKEVPFDWADRYVSKQPPEMAAGILLSTATRIVIGNRHNWMLV